MANNDNITRLEQQTDILCIQVSDEIVAQIQKETNYANILQFSYTDNRSIVEHSKKARAIICGWDRSDGKAPELIEKFKANKYLWHLPIYILANAFNFDEELTREQLKVEDILLLPNDKYRIPIMVYDIINIKEKIERDRRLSELNRLVDSTTVNIDEISRINQIPEPMIISDLELTKTIGSGLEKRNRSRKKIELEAKNNNDYDPRKILVYNQDRAAARGLQRHVNNAFFINTDVATTISEALHLVRSEPFDSILIWHDIDDHSTFKLINELNEARNLSRLGIVILAPSESALKDFALNCQDCVFDQALLFIGTARKLNLQLSDAFDAFKNPNCLSTRLYKLRVPMRNILPGVKPRPLEEERLEDVSSKFLDRKETTYWYFAEKIPHLVMMGKFETANEIATNLRAQYPEKLDALILSVVANIPKDGPQNSAKNLFEFSIAHQQMTLEKYYTIGMILFRLRSSTYLEKLLLDWYKREDIEQDCQFDFLTSCYFELKNEKNKKMKFLCNAIKKAPLRGEFLVALIRHFKGRNDFHREMDIWKFCSESHNINRSVAQLNLAKLYIDHEKYELATEIIDQILVQKPNQKIALRLRSLINLKAS